VANMVRNRELNERCAATNQSMPLRMGAISTNTPLVCASGLATRGINSTAGQFVTGGTKRPRLVPRAASVMAKAVTDCRGVTPITA
jgi:hypothetical protein